ncbi:MAG: hypothetical protein IPK59_16580 [Rhodospirillaceae bacterium]|nr:hypothetical protein [Rhodospirillaceae bacterium]
MYGGDGNDTIHGGADSDYLYGENSDGSGQGDDIIHGDGGNDIIGGGDGNDTITGDDGNDQINGGAGSDHMSGGAGGDVFFSVDDADLSGTGLVDGGDGDDIAYMADVTILGTGQAAHIQNIEMLNFEGGAATTITLDVASVLGMTDGDDVLYIQGDAADALTLTGDWTKDPDQYHTVAGGNYADAAEHTYALYTSTVGGNTVSVYVDTAVQTDIAP